jgi:hypothetical protein
MFRPETATRDRPSVPATATQHGMACQEPHAERCVADDPQCVCAFGRATHSTERSGCDMDGRAGRQSARLWRWGARRPPVAWEWTGAGGPDVLTEYRQKPRHQQCGSIGQAAGRYSAGRHGTRNTVPSRASNKGEWQYGCRLVGQRRGSRASADPLRLDAARCGSSGSCGRRNTLRLARRPSTPNLRDASRALRSARFASGARHFISGADLG